MDRQAKFRPSRSRLTPGYTAFSKVFSGGLPSLHCFLCVSAGPHKQSDRYYQETPCRQLTGQLFFLPWPMFLTSPPISWEISIPLPCVLWYQHGKLVDVARGVHAGAFRSEEHTSELQSLAYI